MNHTELDAYVRQQALWMGLYAFHPAISVGSEKGWPDWVLLGSNGLLFRECKIPPDGCTSEQRAVGYALQAVGQDWAIWTPADVQSGLIVREMERIK